MYTVFILYDFAFPAISINRLDDECFWPMSKKEWGFVSNEVISAKDRFIKMTETKEKEEE